METNSNTPGSPVLQYLAREPKVQSAKKQAIILLHGVGSNEADLFSLADQLPDDFLIICPRGQYTLGAGRYAWYNVDFSTGKPVFDTTQEASSRELIKQVVAQVKQQYKVDEVYLGGFSQGGIMSYSVGLTNPKDIKGIIALSGRLLVEIRSSIRKNDELQQLKVFIAHGVQDNTLPVQYAREAKSYLENLGIQSSYHEYNMGHQVNGAVIKDLNDWLNQQSN
ncbi:MAG: esterase [Ferruginibacter sp.]|uniref:alpha/beta hydrolase n=1 Tax=Ferruginibacter sp. TaxID=1940288 RepID=UPI00265AC1B3|nr:alpha/beta fold hydrolase [Ferruginibacter sp.]MDB5279030.1 esterase [Ferruginibacter sp.]